MFYIEMVTSAVSVKRKMYHYIHHIIFKSNNGTDMPSNLISLCEDCHDKVHKGEITIKGKRSKTKHATEMGIIKSQLKKSNWEFEETFGYETKFKREQVLQLPKRDYYDAVAICCEDGEIVSSNDTVYFRKHVSKGDYQQTKGKNSEKRIPTGKLFGLRKFDLIKTSKGKGFVKGKRASGFFCISNVCGDVISTSVNVKKNCVRLQARTTILTLRKAIGKP